MKTKLSAKKTEALFVIGVTWVAIMVLTMAVNGNPQYAIWAVICFAIGINTGRYIQNRE